MKSATLIILSGLLIVSLILVGCAGSATPAPAPTQPSTAAPAAKPAPTTNAPPAPVSSPTQTSAAKPITLSYTFEQVSGSDWYDAHMLWIKEIETRTNGRIKIDAYPGATVVPVPNFYDAVKTGVVDMCSANAANWAGKFELTQIMNIPNYAGDMSAEGKSKILWQLYEKFPALQAEYTDVKLMGLFASNGPYQFMPSRIAIKSLADLKGKRIRVFPGMPSDLLTSLGAVTMMAPMPDSYLNLSKGVFDGLLTIMEAYRGFKLYEVAPYALIGWPGAPSTASFWFAMNKNKFNSLPKDLQDILNGLAAETGQLYGRNVFDIRSKGIAGTIKSASSTATVFTLSADDAKVVLEASKPFANLWVQAQQKAGKADVQAMLTESDKLVAQYASQYKWVDAK